MFSRPVDVTHPICAYFQQRDRRYDWSVDPDNGLWIPVKDADGMGHHSGTDFDCPVGTVVRAMVDGIVIRCRFESALDHRHGSGLHILQLVMLPGFDSWVLKYSHLGNIHVNPGDKVRRHQPIAQSGNTGNVAKPYLHVDLMDLKRQYRPIPLESDAQ